MLVETKGFDYETPGLVSKSVFYDKKLIIWVFCIIRIFCHQFLYEIFRLVLFAWKNQNNRLCTNIISPCLT